MISRWYYTRSRYAFLATNNLYATNDVFVELNGLVKNIIVQFWKKLMHNLKICIFFFFFKKKLPLFPLFQFDFSSRIQTKYEMKYEMYSVKPFLTAFIYVWGKEKWGERMIFKTLFNSCTRAAIIAPRINMQKHVRRKMTANNAWHGYARVN